MRSTKTLWRTLCVLILAHNACVAQTPQSQASQRDAERQPPQKVEIEINDSQRIQVTAKIDVEFTQRNWHTDWDTLAKLRAAQETKEYAASVLRSFLPDVAVSVGDSWKVKQSAVELLKQLHQGATMDLHHNDDAEGGWAILSALNPQWAEIAFRIHGQFVLEDGRFTPSQFAGRIVIDRHSGNVAYFRMHVPQYTLNFTVGRKMMLALFGTPARERAVSDGGYCPRIELVAGNSWVTDGANWTASLGSKQAEHELALRFYPAWKIDWVPLEEALAKARHLKKPLHIVSAAGPFKDEAC